MSDDLKNILSENNKDIEQEKMLEYLNRTLTEQEQHELEQQLNDDEFMSDAMDGLQEINKKSDVSQMVNELNAGLKKQLDKNKKRRNKRALKQDSFVYYTIVILLLLVVIGFVVIKMFMKD